jgi:biotin synthase
MNIKLNSENILSWLKETDQKRLNELFTEADSVRKQFVGDQVHLRGLMEISNYCTENCGYCGIRNQNSSLKRYRMQEEEILESAQIAKDYGYGTVVMQAGEDPGIEAEWLADIISEIKKRTGSAVTLSLGERPLLDLQKWFDSGANRYLLRFETSDLEGFNRIHGVSYVTTPD